MKKKSIVFLCLLSICLVFSACSKERRGVPDSVIRRSTNFTIDQASKYSISHNVDTAAHIDEIQMKLYYSGAYGSKTVDVPCSYSYSKANDSWTLLDEGPATSKQVLNEKAYIKASPWRGTSEGYHDHSYSITFKKIDMSKMKAVIDCDIDFVSDSIPDISKTLTVDLIETGGSYNLHFLIDYVSYGWPSSEDSLWFWLDINDGLRPF